LRPSRRFIGGIDLHAFPLPFFAPTLSLMTPSTRPLAKVIAGNGLYIVSPLRSSCCVTFPHWLFSFFPSCAGPLCSKFFLPLFECPSPPFPGDHFRSLRFCRVFTSCFAVLTLCRLPRVKFFPPPPSQQFAFPQSRRSPVRSLRFAFLPSFNRTSHFDQLPVRIIEMTELC